MRSLSGRPAIGNGFVTSRRVSIGRGELDVAREFRVASNGDLPPLKKRSTARSIREISTGAAMPQAYFVADLVC